MARIKLPEDGRVVEAAEVSVEGPDVRYVNFDLSDGAKISMRITILSIYRTREYGETGEPLYVPQIRVDTKIHSIPDEYYGKPTKKGPARSPEVA